MFKAKNNNLPYNLQGPFKINYYHSLIYIYITLFIRIHDCLSSIGPRWWIDYIKNIDKNSNNIHSFKNKCKHFLLNEN